MQKKTIIYTLSYAVNFYLELNQKTVRHKKTNYHTIIT